VGAECPEGTDQPREAAPAGLLEEDSFGQATLSLDAQTPNDREEPAMPDRALRQPRTEKQQLVPEAGAVAAKRKGQGQALGQDPGSNRVLAIGKPLRQVPIKAPKAIAILLLSRRKPLIPGPIPEALDPLHNRIRGDPAQPLRQVRAHGHWRGLPFLQGCLLALLQADGLKLEPGVPGLCDGPGWPGRVEGLPGYSAH
jgi:hypothetical protein